LLHIRYRVKQHQRVFKVSFVGEAGIDAGGLYRELITELCKELANPLLKVLTPCPNSNNNYGRNRDTMVPSPIPVLGASIEEQCRFHDALLFLGRLMGMAMRSTTFLPLRLAPVIWKQIVCQNVTTDDILGVDLLSFSMTEAMMESKNCEEFDQTIDQTFTGVTADQILSPLVPYGQILKVTYARRHTYARLLKDFRVHEFRQQVDILRQGMVDVVPKTALMAFDGPELEIAVCGVNTVDIALLKRHTVYQGGYNENHPVIQLFWEVMEKRFDNELRQKYLQFVWGRSRLPTDEAKWETPMKITKLNKSGNPLPLSHTCFFQIDLPEYTDAQVLHDRLKVAIENCSLFDMG